MEFYKKASTANWILKGKIVSKGIYDMEHYIENGEDAVKITKNAYFNPFFEGLVTTITKENGQPYANFAELEAAVKDFFVDAPPYGEIYGATLHEVGSNGELKTVDVCDIFELVPYTCQANLDDNDIIVDEVNLFSEITLGIYALTAQDKVDIANIVIDNATMQELIRKTITPYHASVYLPNNVPFTTALIPINTPTKIKLPTVIKTEHGFGVVDRGGASGYALQYQGTKPITLRVFATTGINASVNNTTFNTFIYKNDVLEDGLGASAKLGTGTDVVTITSGGTMTVNPLDFIEIWISTNSQCRYTFLRTSIMLYEA